MNYSFSNVKKYLLHYTWDIAILIPNNDEDGYLAPFSRYFVLKNPYKGKWFADPFILSYNGDFALLLVEEFDKAINRGRIALLTVDVKELRIINCEIVLDKETHLSYPAIYRIGEDVFVTPENADSGGFDVYKWNARNNKLEYYDSIIKLPLADATILQGVEFNYLFATSLPSPNGSVLNVYKSRYLFKNYEKLFNVSFPENIARMAGAFFIDNLGRLIRPAQECNRDYGNKVVFQSVSINEKKVEFHLISTLEPKGLRYAGIHTFNQYNGMQVIDLKKYDFPLVYTIKNIIKR